MGPSQVANAGDQRADRRVATILLIYQVGNSDFNYGTASAGTRPDPRSTGSSFAALKRRVLADLSIGGSGTAALASFGTNAPLPNGMTYDRLMDETVGVAFPILPVVIDWLAKRHFDARIMVWPVLTDQRSSVLPDGHPQDTIGMDCLFRVYLDLLVKQYPNLQVEVAKRASCDEPYPKDRVIDTPQLTMTWSYATLHSDPSDYKEVASAYESLRPHLNKLISAVDGCYYAVGTGTPQMSFAGATTFGFDARVNFIYKPRSQGDTEPESVDEINHFRDLPRARTLDLLRRSLTRFNFDLAVKILSGETSGFALDDALIKELLLQLNLLADWQRPLLADAARRLKDAEGLAQGRLTRLVAYRLADALHERSCCPNDRIAYWRTALIDALIRLRVWLLSGDIPAFVFGLDRFLDLALTFSLTVMRP